MPLTKPAQPKFIQYIRMMQLILWIKQTLHFLDPPHVKEKNGRIDNIFCFGGNFLENLHETPTIYGHITNEPMKNKQ